MVTNGLKTKLQTNVTELTSCVIKSAVFSYVCAYFYQSLKQSRYAREEGIVVQFPQWHLEIRICNNRSSIPNVNIRQELKQKRTQFRKKPFNQTCNNCNIFFYSPLFLFIFKILHVVSSGFLYLVATTVGSVIILPFLSYP